MEVEIVAVVLLQVELRRVSPLDASKLNIAAVSQGVQVRPTVVVGQPCLHVLALPPHKALTVNYTRSLPFQAINVLELKDSINYSSIALHWVVTMGS